MQQHGMRERRNEPRRDSACSIPPRTLYNGA